MGEGLIIRTSIASAKEILKVIKDPELLFWEDGGHHLDVMAKWLPKKGFRILPKFFDKDYRPGTVGDEADELINKARGCTLRTEGKETTPIWHERTLRLPEMREELNRIIEGNVLDMGFEDDVARVVLKAHNEALYKADEKILEGDNENLKRLANILNMLAECMHEAKRANGIPMFFEFYIPRPDKGEVEKMAIAWLKKQGEKYIQHG